MSLKDQFPVAYEFLVPFQSEGFSKINLNGISFYGQNEGIGF